MDRLYIRHQILDKIKVKIKVKHLAYFLIVFIVISIVLSVFEAILFIICYLIGFISFHYILIYKSRILSILLKICLNKRLDRSNESKSTRIHCTICEDERCSRTILNSSHAPWNNIYLHKQLDQSIENFYNIILQLYISPWYSKLTKEDTLTVQLRYLLRHASGLLLHRALKVNVGEIIVRKLVPCAIKHYILCLKAHGIMKSKNLKSLDEAMSEGSMRYLLHPALLNRDGEFEYLRRITDVILPNLLPKHELNSKLFSTIIREIFASWVLLPISDVLANPDIINTLVILLTGDEKMSQLPELPNDHVRLLENFVVKYQYKQMRLLRLEVADVLKIPEYLYSFMQFMKSMGKINLLQFCLDMDEFNKKLLQPEITDVEQESLYNHACKLQSIYFSPESLSCIAFDEEYFRPFELILNEGPKHILKLQRCKIIYEAYDHVYSLLEKEWAPRFFDSEEFYKLMIANSMKESKKPVNSKSVDKNNSIIGKPLLKLKDAFKTQTINGELLDVDSSKMSDSDSLDGTDFEKQCLDILADYAQLRNKDMTTWRIKITGAKEQRKINKPGMILYFSINVNKIDPHGMGDDCSWEIERNDRDFHKLRDKLIEFHGEKVIGDVHLPSKKVKAAIEMRRIKYEAFIHHLLVVPLLKCSNLLYLFLTTKRDFTEIAEACSDSSAFPDLESLYQNVTHKLQKEKGQHLDSFLQSYFISTDVEYYQSLNDEKKRSNDFEEEATDIVNDMSSISSRSNNNMRRLTESIFGNNFDIYDIKYEPGDSIVQNNKSWDFSESLNFILDDVFHIRKIIVGFSKALCEAEHELLQNYSENFISNYLCDVLSQPRLGRLIKLGQELLFSESNKSHKIKESANYNNARQQLLSAFPSFIITLLGVNFLDNVDVLLSFLQNPKLNKQLTYMLLDAILIELFPELSDIISTK